jgi:hypothetical protein
MRGVGRGQGRTFTSLTIDSVYAAA